MIRSARDNDLEAIEQIAIEAWEPVYQSFRRLIGDELFATIHSNWRTDKVAQIVSHYRSYPETVLVTEYDGQVVGFISYYFFKRRKLGIIGNNAIRPKYQGKGLGTKQYQKVLEIFQKNGMLYAEVITGSDESHAPARAAYEKAEFKPMLYSVTYYRKL